MKCDGLPDPVCVRELNTYLSLWQEDDSREDIDQVLERTQVRTRTGPQEYYGFCKLENNVSGSAPHHDDSRESHRKPR